MAAETANEDEGRLVRRVLIVIGLVAFALLLWELRRLLVLVFGAILVAVIFRALAAPLHRHARLPQGLALAIAIALLAAFVGGVSWMLGAQISQQVATILDKIGSWQQIVASIGGHDLVEHVKEWVSHTLANGGSAVSSVSTILFSLGNGLVDILVSLAAGIYLASQPEPYLRGFVKLFPRERRPLAEEVLDDAGRALRLWLLGQLVAMLVVGTLTGLGYWAIGLPSALTLGLLAGILEFIPLLGPLLAAIPALLLALSHSADLALWTLGLYIVVQQLEGHIITPLVQQYAVDVPAALLLFVILGGGVLFGAIWIILAAPLTVVGFVLVKRLYVREALETPTSIPGEE
ncbi:MAG: AI-2E family transporter [Alphaproteobacteria bacterium]|nr:AI-2E family transporter [Alphaproteobacteria bacterium]